MKLRRSPPLREVQDFSLLKYAEGVCRKGLETSESKPIPAISYLGTSTFSNILWMT